MGIGSVRARIRGIRDMNGIMYDKLGKYMI